MENQADGYERSRYEILRKHIGTETNILYLVFQGKAPSITSRQLNEGDLVFEGQDLGPIVEEMFGDSDYEYNYYIKKSDVDYFVACMMKECFEKGIFETGGQLRQWMEKHQIPFTSWDWV